MCRSVDVPRYQTQARQRFRDSSALFYFLLEARLRRRLALRRDLSRVAAYQLVLLHHKAGRAIDSTVIFLVLWIAR